MTKRKSVAKPRAKKQPQKRTHLIFVVDRSGSMRPIWDSTCKAFDRMARETESAANCGGRQHGVTISLVSFGQDVRIDHWAGSPNVLRPLSQIIPYTGGGTPLFEAVITAIERAKDLPGADEAQTAFFVSVTTDGEENASGKEYTADRLVRLVRERQQTERWTFAFSLPRGRSAGFQALTKYEIPPGNFQEWDATEYGTQVATQATSSGLSSYFLQRNAGHTYSANFYANAGALSHTKVADLLTDISDKTTVLRVDRPTEIGPFVEGRIGKYNRGMAYYQLTKPEKVSPNKLFLIRPTAASRPIYAGIEARTLLALPSSGEVRLTPGYLGKWDVFVQSTSTNRKLMPNTDVIYLG